MTSSLDQWIRSVAVASIAVFIMLAALIVGAELIPELKNWLKATFYHHWLGKGVLALGLFAILSVALSVRRSTARLSSVIFAEALAAILSVLVIAGFFLLHVLKII
ncbi:MAG: hypothetical protein Q7S01_04910 [bacterium]|nr:hypothetical protein [bacterium]